MLIPFASRPIVVSCFVLLCGCVFLLGQTGEVHMEQTRQLQEQDTRAAVDKFDEAFNRHDADALAALLTDDTVFEDTSPAPDGRRIEGKPAVVEFWRGWFARNSG